MPAKSGSEAFSILKLLQKTPSQTPRPDVPLFSFGRLLGTPSWWDFSGSATFDSLLDYYGNIQVELWVQGEQVEVCRVCVRMWTAISGRPEPKKGKMKYAARRYIKFNGFEPGLSVEESKMLLQAASISFEEIAVADASETVVLLILPNKIEMLFFMMDGRPSLAEIQAYSEHDGA
ncbi:hypothetical protein DTW90_18400 [Neorhizobium sp. P12A]|uniref:hypothetical protein n=1 Tax=Neorhizobium sp. P12A TaxID=2268027 RepID=UPI0011EE6529|nr:hypothetical protein [Neorhizobium sp. P12A]KAA0697402.1 hypothetical protein DTW90_18400 [Neorhizobium sp. P12A]